MRAPGRGPMVANRRRNTFGGMFGYIIGIGLAFLLFVLCFTGLSIGGPRAGRKTGPDKPVQPEAPAADEPTPDRSATAAPRQINSARGHTPPA